MNLTGQSGGVLTAAADKHTERRAAIPSDPRPDMDATSATRVVTVVDK